MLHRLELPEITEQCLTEVVYAQMALLYCAVAATNIGTSSPELNLVDFARYLNEWSGFEGRGQELVMWITKEEGRYKPLRDFATHYSSMLIEELCKEKAVKLAWCQRLADEVEAMLDKNIPVLAVKDFFTDEDTFESAGSAISEWKYAARQFLFYFYENYLKEDTKFPKELFKDKTTTFGRQELLRAFLTKNEKLEICAACDQGRYYSYKTGRIYAVIDHYLPKSRYPHFVCHPYNLVPTCYGCNSSQKGDKDPFLDRTGKRCSLGKYCLPYHSNLREATYLNVDLSGLQTIVDANELDSPKKVIRLGPLQPRGDSSEISETELQQAIQILHELHGIPDRWADPEQSNRIRGTLFRRMRQFLSSGKHAPLESDIPSQIHNNLNILLYYLDQEDQQRDPFAFAMTWILVALMNEYMPHLIDRSDKSTTAQKIKDPFIEEIVSWYGLSLEKNAERASVAQKLLEIPGKATEQNRAKRG